MKSMGLVKDGHQVQLKQQELPRPEPGTGQLLIQVYAAGVTHTELLWYPTWRSKTGELRQNPVPGHEFSGVVAGVGKDVTSFGPGDEVYGMNDWFENGATAEYCMTIPSSIAFKPSHLSHAESASVPIGALTAWQGLFDRAKLQAGEHVLVQGGAGGVGAFAIQLAHSRGAHVTATGSPANFDFMRELGADEAIDYNSNYFEENAGKFDVVFDVIGGGTLRRSWALLKPDGRMVTIASESEGRGEEPVKQAFFVVEPNQSQLKDVAELLDSGRLRAIVDTVVPFEQAPAAYTGKFKGKRGRGKVVVAVA